MDICIRQAEDCDIEHVVSLCGKQCAFNRGNHSEACKYDEYEPVLQATLEKMRYAFLNRDENALFLLAEGDGAPFAYVYARIYEECPTADDGGGRMGILEKLFLAEEARGSGLGQRLLDETMDWFLAKGMRRVRIHAYSWNQRARGLYEKNGFREYAVSFEKFI